jgi:cell division protein FtsW
MVFVASPEFKRFFLILMGGVAFAGIFVLLASCSYRMQRIQVWLHPENFTSDSSYQTLQGLYAIGSGGLFGKGLGESMQKLGFVPEAQNDMIFSIICEELGLFGAICVILMYILLLWRLVLIATKAKDIFGSFVVIGIMAHMALQVILNIAVVTNTIPNTGITLPFISYGGTSIMFLVFEMFVALSVSKGLKLEEV